MKDFVEIVKKNYADTELILKAFDFACEAHKNAKRKSGEPYIIHPLCVAKILIENTQNTFTTAVFNGSSALRNVAGELIEETRKATERNQTINDAFFEKTFDKMNSLYKLDQYSQEGFSKQELGDLPEESAILLCSISAIWLGLLIYFAIVSIRKKKKAIKY